MNNNDLIQFPDMAVVRQKLCSNNINVSETVDSALGQIHRKYRSVKTGTVAVAVGSRKIDQIDIIVRQTILGLKQNGFEPFIVPAMGSNGGATPEGQKKVLEKLKITESVMNVPILANMDVEKIGTHPSGMNIYFSKEALSADHIVVINRVKPHTKFKLNIESGLCKMLTIGLGKATGASCFHNFAISHTFKIIEEAAEIVMKRINLLYGIAIVEDGYGKVSIVEAVSPAVLIDREKALLVQAASMLGSIPFDDIDILVIDYIGKDISGIGMDSNITGRHRDIVGDFNVSPHVKRIFVRDLSPKSDGNANGIGLADFTTTRLVSKIDMKKTFINAVTAISPEKAAIPIHYETDRQCLAQCFKTTGITDPSDLRVVRIKDTASLEFLQVSRALQDELATNPKLTQIGAWEKFRYDLSDNLSDFVT